MVFVVYRTYGYGKKQLWVLEPFSRYHCCIYCASSPSLIESTDSTLLQLFLFGTVRGGLELLLHCLKPDTWTEWMVSCSLQHLHIIRSEINDICCSDISTLYKLPDHLVFHLDNPPVCYVHCSKKPKRLALLLVRTFFFGRCRDFAHHQDMSL